MGNVVGRSITMTETQTNPRIDIVKIGDEGKNLKASSHFELASCYPNRQELPSHIIEKENHCYKITFCSFDSKIGTIKISHFDA